MHSPTEWLETDGLGGFAGGTVDGVRTRRYHGLLVAADTPPTGRMLLVNGLDAEVMTPRGRFALTAQRYAPDAVHPADVVPVDAFTAEPWPTWRWRLPDGTTVVHELFIARVIARATSTVVLRWRQESTERGVMLGVRPYLSGRDYHALHHENPNFRWDCEERDGTHRWQPYPDVPPVHVRTNGARRDDAHWYRQVRYAEELARGFECDEDVAAPCVFEYDLDAADAVMMLSIHPTSRADAAESAVDIAARHRRDELARRRAFASPLHRAADQYIVRRGAGTSIIAGYPWFTDWGRDTFIAMRGLCLTTGRLDDARSMLVTWAGAISQGMIPNRFPDAGETPEYNAVDASLWYVVAAHEFLEHAARAGFELARNDRAALRDAMIEIVTAYARGTRYGIHGDRDGLLAAGEPGQQLTWMDARVDGREMTPRIGKPVEVQALWLNALLAAGAFDARWHALHDRGRRTFVSRFWNPERSCLRDVIDVDHVAGTSDDRMRPNQVLAMGGLPVAVFRGRRARVAMDTVEAALWTPLGLRSLSPDDPAYVPRYAGGPRERDAAYHAGTVWPWWVGPFVDAWLRVRRSDRSARRTARERFVAPLLAHLGDAGLGHVSEVADGDPPHAPGGCPFQAWSVGELLRALAAVDEPGSVGPRSAPTRSRLATAR